MKINNICRIIIAAVLLISLSACGVGEDGIAMRELKLSEDTFKTLGRVYYNDGKIYCALSGTGVEFTFKGTECHVTVSGDDMASAGNADSNARIGIYLNGERVVDDMIDQPEKTYQVFKTDSEITADIKIVKLSESANSTYAISNITLNGTAPKPAEYKDKLIEFVGDSITCGYGVDDLDSSHHFSTRTEDNTKTYAYKTAEALEADYSMVSFSGYGVISGYSDGNSKADSQVVPAYYEKYGYSWSSNGEFTPSNLDWTFERQPDVVVINLGTNDDSYCKNIPERCEEFREEYINFIKKIREKNPDATIIGALGIMGANLYPYVESAVSDYIAQTGDENVYAMKFDSQNQAVDGIAADWHPSEATHEKAAAKLTDFIKQVKGW